MQNGTGDHPAGSTHPIPYGTPDGDYSVISGDRGHRSIARLDRLANGTRVIAAGMVSEIREHGPIDTPRATFVLTNDIGQATYAAADTDTLTAYSLFLMDGVEVSLHGIARRPFEDGPPYIQVTEVEPLVD